MTREIVITEILHILDKFGYKSEMIDILDNGLITKDIYESIIEEGDPDHNGEAMPFGIYVSWTITCKDDIATLLISEFTDMKTGQIINYLYDTDYYLFKDEFEKMVKRKATVF